MQEAVLHAVVGADLLEDIPGKDLVQLVGDEGDDDGAEAEDDGNGNEVGPA